MDSFFNYIIKKFNKKIRVGILSNTGRNNTGRICVSGRRSGNKHKYRYLDYYRRVNNFGYILKLVKDSVWTSFIGCILYKNGLISSILVSEGVDFLSNIYSGSNINNKKVDIGYAVPLLDMNLFSMVNNVELKPFKGAQLCRAAGSSGLLIKKINNYYNLKLKSGWILTISSFCLASLGVASNIHHRNDVLRKAGKSFALGRRPKVRGVAMNPCDHPHGGGEGRKSPRRAQVSPWGWKTKGTPSKRKKIDKEKKKLYKIKRKK